MRILPVPSSVWNDKCVGDSLSGFSDLATTVDKFTEFDIKSN